MKVDLVDLDMTGFGNLALMKLSAWYKARGDSVFFKFPLAECDKTYISCIFPYHAQRLVRYPTEGVEIGGSGFAMDSSLAPEIEHIMPDYSLYGLGHSMGFTSRGCPHSCPWCIVPDKEGGIQPWAEIYEFWDRRHRRIMLLDNNLLAAPNWMGTLQALVKEGLEVDFNQGLDIRLVDDERAYWLARERAPILRFSFDLPGMAEQVRLGVGHLVRAGVPPGRISFYVLVGFNTSFQEDQERFRLLRELGCQAHPMFYRDEAGREHPPGKAGGWVVMPRGSRWAARKYIRLATGRREVKDESGL